eukprot:CAMPEP_0185260972 /NCGR_PEP_ID=MMETSP1359-20130426/9476_1 /TAXON_ID=552665 /ORGANISM="Bigelowiella longifila, Strain CCMP242" /LENGTH=109 /DNA_ID=CAMNT_0027847439 /DNA_START=574 /DNA_END=901 /DNA_ORIENTATION=-
MQFNGDGYVNLEIASKSWTDPADAAYREYRHFLRTFLMPYPHIFMPNKCHRHKRVPLEQRDIDDEEGEASEGPASSLLPPAPLSSSPLKTLITCFLAHRALNNNAARVS